MAVEFFRLQRTTILTGQTMKNPGGRNEPAGLAFLPDHGNDGKCNAFHLPNASISDAWPHP